MRPDYTEPFEWSPHYYALIEDGMRQTDCLMICVAHQGRHPFVDDGCHELPKPLSKRERVRIALQDRPAVPEPWRVERESMVAALVEAGELMLERRRAERAAAAQAGYQSARPVPAPPEPRNGEPEPDGSRVISGVPVVMADDGDS